MTLVIQATGLSSDILNKLIEQTEIPKVNSQPEQGTQKT